MQLHEKNPLRSDWTHNAARSPLAPSLAPHELSDLDAALPQASPEHRARLQRYVKVAVASSVILCLAALVRVGVAHVSGSPTDENATAYVSSFQPTAAAQPAPEGAPAAHATTPPTTTAAGTTRPGADKEAARRALESGKAKAAVAAAQRATESDPSDADAWLLLGAAQGELGHTGAARAAYRACVKSAKHGAVRECGAMLR